MKEIRDIINAFTIAVQQGRKAALATVVHVVGSSYRRPGARMLVTEEGELTGAISGGCLEGDALRKALLAIHQQQNKLVTYDTTDEDDAKFGVQLGCNGIVHILFEPITKENNPIELLQRITEKRESAVLVTLFSLVSSSQPGTALLHRQNETISRLLTLPDVTIEADAREALLNRASSTHNYLSEEGKFTAFLEFIPPVVSMVIAGAGNDVQPLVQMAALLGWQATVVDGRNTHATAARFPQADDVRVAQPDEVLKGMKIDRHTVFLLMTHNYNYDLALLKLLLSTSAGYIGVLGPKKKIQRMYNDLEAEAVFISNEQRARIHAPVGLDIGAETAEEIAVSIVAEIKAALNERKGGWLKDKGTTIHQRSENNSTIYD